MQNKKIFFDNTFILFSLAFIIRFIYLMLQNPTPEKLIEDELLYWNAANVYLDKGILEESIRAERMFGVFIYIIHSFSTSTPIFSFFIVIFDLFVDCIRFQSTMSCLW